MPKNRIIIILGVLVALLPLVGFPRAWEVFFQIVAGLSIVLVSVWSTIDKKLSLKAKAQARLSRQIDVPEVPEPGMPSGQRVTDVYPKTGQPGRRLTDLTRTGPEKPLS
ncbi:MAG: hypothetical protein Q7R67_00090 [bacterium]|nr:hypothetical protein [bacterium]